MQYIPTTALDKILSLKKRLRIIQGGTSAGKTIAILMELIDIAQSQHNILISVVSETMPHLRKGARKDFLDIMKARNYFEDKQWNETNSFYTFETGSTIEFFSADSSDKVRGPRRDYLFINECNNISFETYSQLALRTNKVIFLDYNPITEFWVHTEIPKTGEPYDFIILTYKDNEGLPEAIIREIESRRGNKQFWRVYGEGQIGYAEGLIYPNWRPIDAVPEEARLVRRPLDFGYTNDPTAGLGIYKWNDSYVLDEEIYQTGLLNGQIADLIYSFDEPKTTIVADSAEPKSIAELRARGLMVLAAPKGKDSVKNGIQLVQSQKIFYTTRSLNLIKERRSYFFMEDKDGKLTNEPSPIMNHLMDAVRYGFQSLLESVPEAVKIKQMTRMDNNDAQFRSGGANTR